MKISCPHCKQILDVNDEMGGQYVSCPTCNNPFTIKQDKKQCPFCAESINNDAIKCRYCHSDLSKKIDKDEYIKLDMTRKKCKKNILRNIIMIEISILIASFSLIVSASQFASKNDAIFSLTTQFIPVLCFILFIASFIGIIINQIQSWWRN